MSLSQTLPVGFTTVRLYNIIKLRKDMCIYSPIIHISLRKCLHVNSVSFLSKITHGPLFIGMNDCQWRHEHFKTRNKITHSPPPSFENNIYYIFVQLKKKNLKKRTYLAPWVGLMFRIGHLGSEGDIARVSY